MLFGGGGSTTGNPGRMHETRKQKRQGEGVSGAEAGVAGSLHGSVMGTREKCGRADVEGNFGVTDDGKSVDGKGERQVE